MAPVCVLEVVRLRVLILDVSWLPALQQCWVSVRDAHGFSEALDFRARDILSPTLLTAGTEIVHRTGTSVSLNGILPRRVRLYNQSSLDGVSQVHKLVLTHIGIGSLVIEPLQARLLVRLLHRRGVGVQL